MVSPTAGASHQDGAQPPRNEPWWANAAGIAPAIVLLGGVAVYGLLSAAYDKYYAELGLTPADLGVLYGRSLGGAAVGTIAFGLLAALVWAAIWVLVKWQTVASTRTSRTIAGTLVATVVLGQALLLVLALVTGVVAGVLLAVGYALVGSVLFAHHRGSFTHPTALPALIGGAAAFLAWVSLLTLADLVADKLADRVKDGEWVQTPESGGLVVFSVRAMPVAELTATTTSAADKTFAEDRGEHRLMFLGTANGMIVLYDATAQEALLLPTGQFRTPVVNCETDKNRGHPSCQPIR